MKKLLNILLVVTLVAALALPAFASEEGKLIVWADDTRAKVITAMGEEFTAKYGIPVEVKELGFGDIRDNLGVAGPAGEGPDIIVGAHDWLGQLVANGLVAPIDLAGKEGEFRSVALEAFTWGGDLYGVPYSIEAIGLIRNKALVPEAPKTFEEVVEISRKLTDRETKQYGFILQQPDPYHTFPLMSANGGYVFGTNPDGTLNPLDVGLNNEGAIKGLELFDSMLEEGLIPIGVDYNTMTTLFKEGKAAMVMTGPWAFADFKAAGIDYEMSPIPTIDGGQPKPFVGVQGFLVSAFSENKMLANVFLTEYIATKEAMLALYEGDRRPPAYLPAAEEVKDEVDIASVGASAALGTPMPAIPEMSAVWTAWTDGLELIINQELEPQEAMDNAVAQIIDTIKASQQ